MYSFRTYDGHLNWTFRASGAVKGGVAFAHNTIYFGDYGARVHAVNAANGREVWSAAGGGTLLLDAGGRVRAGVHRQHQRGGVCASGRIRGPGRGPHRPAPTSTPHPAVGRRSRPRARRCTSAPTTATCTPTAPTPAALRWSHGGGGRIDGSATIVGNVVYYSSLGSNTTVGLNWRTGRQVVLVPGRRVHSGDHRRKGRVPDRLLDHLPDGSEAFTDEDSALVPRDTNRRPRAPADPRPRACGTPARRPPPAPP